MYLSKVKMIKSTKTQDSPMILGILGGGQLAKMLANSAYTLGLNIGVIDKEECTPAGDMTQLEFSDGWTKSIDLADFSELCDIVTLENEFIDPKILKAVQKDVSVFPSPETMELVQDKFIQKKTFSNFGIHVPEFEAINNEDSARQFADKFGYPFIIKTRKLGYDGYGNFTINSQEDISVAFKKFKQKQLMAERFIDFTKELAVMVARSTKGEIAVYPCVETIQKNHICNQVIAPAPIEVELQKKAQEMAVKCVESINGIGVFGIELFLTDNGNILVNEIAPRPHNSGHYTIEACITSQYENCIRAILGMPLGSTDMYKPVAVMINLLGKRDGQGTPENVSELFKFNRAKLHLYNKKASRVGRKMGHITVLGDEINETINYAQSAAEALVW
jgi:5-(carboxyamino)imidazole ribonucleotide synthase